MNRILILLVALSACAASQNDTQAITYDAFLKNRAAHSSDLTGQGVWVFWDAANGGIPKYAVYGGFEEHGPTFIMRADHVTDTHGFVGKIPGKYEPMTRRALIAYEDGKVYEKQHIEILLQSNHMWTDKTDTRPEIITPYLRSMCRVQVDDKYWIPGTYRSNSALFSSCIVPYKNGVIRSIFYQALKKKC